jgi:xanthine dehydrogenase accessory factor
VRDIMEELVRWHDEGRRVAVARVIEVGGSAPRLPGAAMAVNDEGQVAGSVSGGCVEAAVVSAATEVLATGRRVTVDFGYSDAEGMEVGLTCGGNVRLFIEPLDW